LRWIVFAGSGIHGTSAKLDITGTTFSGNNVLSSTVHGGGAFLSSCTATMFQCEFSNHLVSGSGGGLFIAGGVTNISESVFSSNGATTGGGIFASEAFIFASLSEVTSNYATNGGGVYITGISQSTLIECKLSKNTATGNGGGAFVSGKDSVFSLVAHEFLENAAFLNAYRDLFSELGSLNISNGCPNGLHNFGTDILRCYGCGAVYPANLSRSACEPWTPNSTVSTANQLAGRVMFNRKIILESSIFLQSEIAILGNFEPLTNLIIDGVDFWEISGGDRARCFYVANPDTEVVFMSLVVTNCKATTESFSFNFGGGVFVGSFAALSLQRTKIRNCSAVSGFGSGLYVANRGMLNASHTHVLLNHGAAEGAGLYIDSGSNANLFDVNFRENKATARGGGCYNNGGNAKFQGCSFYSNEALNSSGGALYLTGSLSTTSIITYEFNLNLALSYNDLYKAGGALFIGHGCSEDEYTYGSSFLMCYGCSLTYPANLSAAQCRPWTARTDVQSERELAFAIMHNSTIHLTKDITVSSELAVLGYIPLTGLFFDGSGVYTIYASQEQQQRRALLAAAPTRLVFALCCIFLPLNLPYIILYILVLRCRCIYIGNPGTELTLSGIGLSGCEATSSSFGGYYGGAVYLESGTTLHAMNTNIKDNKALGGQGGAIYSSGHAVVSLFDSQVLTSEADDGGGIFAAWPASLTAVRSILRGCNAESYGGNIYLEGISSSSSASAQSALVMNDSVVIGGIARTYSGGGLYVGAYSKVSLSGAIISSNVGYQHGAGLYFNGASPDRMTTFTMAVQCIVYNNTIIGGASHDAFSGNGTYHGAGIWVSSDVAGSISDTRFESNAGATYGGGMSLCRFAHTFWIRTSY